jgi:hypothetical protein
MTLVTVLTEEARAVVGVRGGFVVDVVDVDVVLLLVLVVVALARDL